VTTAACSSLRRRRLLLLAALATVFTLGVLVEPSMAASNVGRNVGNELKALAAAIFLPLAAICALPLLPGRKVGALLGMVVVVVIVGGFIFAPAAIVAIAKAIANSISP
jgi:hypothetical protein